MEGAARALPTVCSGQQGEVDEVPEQRLVAGIRTANICASAQEGALSYPLHCSRLLATYRFRQQIVVRNAKAPVARYGRAAASHASQPPSSVGEKYHAAANDRRRCASVYAWPAGGGSL